MSNQKSVAVGEIFSIYKREAALVQVNKDDDERVSLAKNAISIFLTKCTKKISLPKDIKISAEENTTVGEIFSEYERATGLLKDMIAIFLAKCTAEIILPENNDNVTSLLSLALGRM